MSEEKVFFCLLAHMASAQQNQLAQDDFNWPQASGQALISNLVYSTVGTGIFCECLSLF